MKDLDQLLLEQAYQDILLDEKFNWKGALTGAAMAAATLLGGVKGANAQDLNKAPQSIEQQQKLTAEDLLPRKEFDQILDMMREQVQKGDMKAVKQIYDVVRKECQDAATKVSGSNEIRKCAAMQAEALKIWNDMYLGAIKGGLNSMVGQ